MLKELLEYLEDKKILILGVGLEGKSTYHFLRRHFPEKKLFIADKNRDLLEKNPEFMEDIHLELNMGENYLNGMGGYDVILKTPGISFKNIDITSFQDKITSQLELFFEFIECFTIGITGTKGKSTTSSLTYQVLKDQGKDVFLLANIGDPIFDHIEHIHENSIAVLELSSHALQYVQKSPNIALLLNIYEEHLDHYTSFEEYANAKFNVTKFQNQKDCLIYNYDNETMKQFKYRENDYAITLKENTNTKNSVYIKEENIYCNNRKIMSLATKLNLKGMHHINNIMFVLAICDILNLNLDTALQTIQNFEPLEHRMEFVGKFDSVEYYNDSIATIPESTINTIEALENVNTLIVGGKDRGVELHELIQFLQNSKVENIICLPKTGEYIYQGLKEVSNKKVWLVQNLEEAVKIAKENTKKDTICVLSPAASSYGYFKNFEERGNLFKEFVCRDDIKTTTNNDLT